MPREAVQAEEGLEGPSGGDGGEQPAEDWGGTTSASGARAGGLICVAPKGRTRAHRPQQERWKEIFPVV